ncbi:hypothetical protein UK14_04685 [Streptomyces sp. NRRL F-4428]|nr:hypothetical protein UK14_04685 [Streptomyces sp. NRRL F-4428]
MVRGPLGSASEALPDRKLQSFSSEPARVQSARSNGTAPDLFLVVVSGLESGAGPRHRMPVLYGCYSKVYGGGEEIRRDLRPVAPVELTGTGRWMHQIAVRDGQEELANGITHLFGNAECPRCASVFSVAEEYTSANRPIMP